MAKKIYESPRVKGTVLTIVRSVCFDGSLYGNNEGMSTQGGAYTHEDNETMNDETGYW